MYVDESGTDEYLYRERGWAKKGEKIIGEISGKKFQRLNSIAGKCMKEIHAPIIYKGITDTEFFNTWLKDHLLPEIGPGKIIVMDNATFHKNEKTRKIIEDAKCILVYLPAYSPDLNPIEKFWSWLKKTARNIMSNYTSLEEVLKQAFLMWN